MVNKSTVTRTTLCTIEYYFWTKIVYCIFLHVFVSPQRCIGSNVQASHRCYHLSGMAPYRQFSVCGIWLWRSGHAMGLSCRKRQRGWRKRKAVRCSTAITIHSYGKWWWVKCKLLRLVFSVQAEQLIFMHEYYSSYYIHFEITSDPYNLIGSHQCTLFTNRTIICTKSHLFPSLWRYVNKIQQPIACLIVCLIDWVLRFKMHAMKW